MKYLAKREPKLPFCYSIATNFLLGNSQTRRVLFQEEMFVKNPITLVKCSTT